MTVIDHSTLDGAFAEAMAGMEPFEPNPALTAAVSGGADSMALALLGQDWVRRRHGTLRALVVDHGLRPESQDEARITVSRLHGLGIAATLLPLTNLQLGPALAERARIARYKALLDACGSAGSLHLLLGHHADDQAETLMIRAIGNSLTHGLAGMPAVSEHPGVRLLRPLLTTPPALLRQLLLERGVEWVEDPSNRDTKALRPRIRQLRAEHGSGSGTAELIAAAHVIGVRRAEDEVATAVELAKRAMIRPEGYVLLSPGRIGVAALAALIRTVGGGRYLPSLRQIAELAARPRPATVAGVRLLPARRPSDGILLVREEAAIATSVAAQPNAIWDERFRLILEGELPPGAVIGKLGQDATRFRRQSPLPAVILRTLPAIWSGKKLAAVPHLGYAEDDNCAGAAFLFTPRHPVAGSCFRPA